MKLPFSIQRREAGYILWAYVALIGIGMLGMAAMLSYATNAAKRTARDNELITTSYVAESLVEKTRGWIQWDNKRWGEAFVTGRTNSVYSTQYLASADSTFFSGYGFTTPMVTRVATNAPIPLDPPFTGWTNIGYKYQVIVTASNKVSDFRVPVTIGVEVNLVTLTIFHNAVFYGPDMDLEINPGANMTISGTVYAGGSIYAYPGASLTFTDDISATKKVLKGQSPLDPSTRSLGTVVLQGPSGLSLSNTPLMTMPLGTNQGGFGANTPAAVRAILEVPATNEDISISTNRMYNKADLIIKVTDTNVMLLSGNYNSNSVVITSFPTNLTLIRTNASENFYDGREGLTVKPTVVDIGALRAALTNSAFASDILAKNGIANINTLFVDDSRSRTNTSILASTNTKSTLSSPWQLTGTTNSTNYYVKTTNWVSLPAIVLTNGAVLPNGGLTVATPDPLYIKGDYNVSKDGITQTKVMGNTTNTQPGAIMADAITVLSRSWTNSPNSTNTLSNRIATNTTVNAAFLTGNVPSDGVNYSGGLENFPRFLENWSSKTFTYNGSMVCMFPSQVAKKPWPGTGTVYQPPTRNWAFDKNFLGDAAQLPPASPSAVVASKGRWAILTNGATRF